MSAKHQQECVWLPALRHDVEDSENILVCDQDWNDYTNTMIRVWLLLSKFICSEFECG